MAAQAAAVGIRALLFDLDNTLVDTAGASSRALRRVEDLLKSQYGYEESTAKLVIEKFNTKLQMENLDCIPGVNIDEERILLFEAALQETDGLDPDQGLAAKCYFLWKATRLQHMHIPNEVKAMLRSLRHSYKLLLLTNGSATVQREKISACQCQQYFDTIVIGGEHQEQKPALSIFQKCFQLLGVEADGCMMIGDNLDTDIKGGVNAGLGATVWINNTNVTCDEGAMPDYTVKSVLEVMDILGKERV
ncbi:N-acylneuraminate-9-phosphatase [Leucoraja erinacea]|uniref:N-acylneuraminate-9-phosphatase n=1 Tax=Leucoraja erinaceus TaxID=7782 RepID=UPI002454E7A0|nr:N-acylneuraminate-9-phosphatase [Leucoraja erinacea]